MSISVVVLAAGVGSRMKSSTPKVLHKISGKEMLYFSLKVANELSDDVHLVLNHQENRIKDRVSKYFDNIIYHRQNVESFPGTGGAIMDINTKYEKVLVLNGDMPLITTQELNNLCSIDSDITMSIFDVDNPSGYGRVVLDGENVLKIVEEKDATDEIKAIKSVNAGVYLFKKSILERYLPKLSNNNKQSEYYLTDIIELANIDKCRIKAMKVNKDSFKGVNSKYDLSQANDIMQNNIKKELMQNGITINMPNSVYIEYGTTFIGESTIQNGVSILGDSIINNSTIKTNSIIESSTIKNSSIGPMARIRPESKIEDSHIGNFVEIKKSNLTNVKAGHLSYLGDSEIESGTNIGAGVITCNYDGKNKYKTKIGKNVFVGSDSQLIAPITIEDNVIIGAGTTITKNINSGSLAISRTPLKLIENFFYKFFK